MSEQQQQQRHQLFNEPVLKQKKPQNMTFSLTESVRPMITRNTIQKMNDDARMNHFSANPNESAMDE
jgi:hypothetical protein